MKKDYEAPTFRELGTLVELTEQPMNKIGRSTDLYSVETQNNVVGSLVPAQ